MRVLLILLLMACGNAVAAVVQYDFSYEVGNGEQIVGSINGELQADGDTIGIIDLLSIDYTGADLNYSLSTDGWESDTLSLSGDTIEFRTSVPYAASPDGLSFLRRRG